MVAKTGNATPDAIVSEEKVSGALDNAFQGHQAYGEKPPEDRTSRARSQRSGDPVHPEYEDVWQPAGMLDTTHIPPRPGFVQRWVRTKFMGEDDPQNIMKRMNQGYRPRLADTVPAGAFAPTVNSRQFGDIIGIDGMVLMERPEKLHKAHAQHNRDMTNRQMEAVHNMLNKTQESRGLGSVEVNASSKTETGHRAAPVADED